VANIQRGNKMNAIFSVKQAAKEIGVSGSMIYKMMKKGELAYVQVGRRRFPLAESLKAYVDRNTHKEKANQEPMPQFRHLFR
jgi:excisionase family DNA binding protein